MNDTTISTTNKNSYYLLFNNNEIMLKESEDCPGFPLVSDVERLNIEVSNIIYVGSIDENHCYAASVSNNDKVQDYFSKHVRELYGKVTEEIFFLTLRALHFINWLSKTKYCRCCGKRVQIEPEKTHIKCLNCGHITYTCIGPAIIVAVLKEDKILLVRSSNYTTNTYSLISGFVEPGETLETCVKREVKEEVGIDIKNIKYFGSHPWPFSNTLMIGYTAEYSSGEIILDNNEIEAGGWFLLDDLPTISVYNLSFARKIIDWILEHRKK